MSTTTTATNLANELSHSTSLLKNILDSVLNFILEYNLLVLLAILLTFEIMMLFLSIKQKRVEVTLNHQYLAAMFKKKLIAKFLLLLLYVVLINFSILQNLDTFLAQNINQHEIYLLIFIAIFIFFYSFILRLQSYSWTFSAVFYLISLAASYISVAYTAYLFSLYQNFSIMPHLFLNTQHPNFYLAFVLNFLLCSPIILFLAELSRFLMQKPKES